ncbi:MAG: imidazole glycerol phosphate synthase subunit HisH [Armatimonadota bacterium]|nr:imidazole glycerol phosphate synthase subunit HisH [Armatimonadota bacterium]
MRVAIIDYGAGNLRSVQKALACAGLEADIVERPESLSKAAAIVLPGVGAFGPAMARLRERGFDVTILEMVTSGVPLLGLCLGMQLLFEESLENGLHRGLGLLPGRVERLPAGLKVPHMGWNQLNIQQPAPFLEGLPNGSYVYFVHSYYAVPREKSIVSATTTYGVEIPAVVGRGVIWGCQFHPEKSSVTGLKILSNFRRWLHKYSGAGDWQRSLSICPGVRDVDHPSH